MNALPTRAHLTEQAIEDVAFRGIERKHAPEILEHLLFCDGCSEKLEAELQLSSDLRQALKSGLQTPVTVLQAPKCGASIGCSGVCRVC